MESKMEARPPVVMEAIVRRLIPPMAREEVTGDLWERYRSPVRYLAEALAVLPAILASQLRRNSSLPMLGLQAFILYACLGGFAIESGTPPIWARAAIPALAALIGLAFRDIYRTAEHPTLRTALADAFVALVCMSLAEITLVALARADLLSERWVLSVMRDVIGALSLPILGMLRIGSMLGGSRPVELVEDYRHFQRRTLWRNAFETGALTVSNGLSAVILWHAKPGLVPTLGWIMMCGYIAVVVYLGVNGWARSLPPGTQSGPLRSLYQQELARQNQLRRVMWWIWFVPLYMGLGTNLVLKGIETDNPMRAVLGFLLAALLSVCIAGLNRDRSSFVLKKIALLGVAGR
jgi:hypothetical protein